MKENQNPVTKNVDSSLPKVALGQSDTSGFKKLTLPIRKKLKLRRSKDTDYENAELPMMIGNSSRQTVVVSEAIDDIKLGGRQGENKNKRRAKRIIYFIGIGVCVLVAVYCATKINLWGDDNDSSQDQLKEVQSMVVERVIEPDVADLESEIMVDAPTEPKSGQIDYSKLALVDVDFSKLKTVNSDTKAYIKVNGLDVSAPIVQTTDNKFYLTHSFDRKYNSAGWIFGDYRNDWDNLKQNTIIYGHNRRNYIMFGSLKKILDRSWYENKENHVIYVSTENSNMLFQIFSAYTIPTETYYLTNKFDSDEEYQNFLNTIVSRSKVKFDTTPTTEDKILTLSTCHTSSTKMVVHAKLIKIQEKQ